MLESASPTPTLGVVIVSWNVKTMLDACLLSLREELGRTKIHATVWVVDNASSDGSTTMVRARHPWVNLEASPENLGFVRGNNLILERLQQQGYPDFVWLLNPDTVIQAGALSILLHFFTEHPRAGLVGPQLLNPDGSLQTSAFRFPGLLQPLFDLGWLPQRFYYTRFNGRYPENRANGCPLRIDHPLGAAMMARGEAIAQVGKLDEQFFMYCEEIDWAWRMHKAGWEVWLVPGAKVVHYGGASTQQARPLTTAYLWESRARLYRKHRDPLTRALVGAVVRRSFAKKARDASTEEWHAAYSKIVAAWKSRG
ncbi:MAG TPA: glycosyltransferase family 2 protein [Anaerolineae bacterium]|nr:glycosyltransferase family 2 protein [Anaerolineae bacterium]HQK14624.1 glycosyltransferase family 2 protein [Anaerolineae bacterium]